MTTGEKLQKLRKDGGYTQEELADIMSVSRQSISKWESDIAFPETEKIIALSKLYHCSTDYLLNNDNNEFVKKESAPKREFNKKRLPLIVFTGAFYFLTLLLFFIPWFKVESKTYLSNGYMVNVTYYLNTYQTVFTVSPDNEAAILLSTALLLLAIIIQGVAVTYIFVESKAFNISLKVGNLAFMLFTLLNLCVASSQGNPCIQPVLLFGLSLVLCVLQFAVPQLRKTR